MDFFNYVVNNYLIIDKSTYLTIVIGQITIYGILLTFYQFLSYQRVRYLVIGFPG